MPIQPAPSHSAIALNFTPAGWDLLLRLPRQVLIAATSAERDSARHTVAEGLAGIEAIAAGRASPSRLVRDIVAAIYAESGEESPVAEEFTDPASGIANVLELCRAAARLLADRTAAGDSAAYRGWLTDIATTVCAATRTGGMLGFGGVTVSAAEQRFLDGLASALAG